MPYDETVGTHIETGCYDDRISVRLNRPSLGGPVIELDTGSTAAIDTAADYNRVRSELIGGLDECARAAGWELVPDLTLADFGAVRRRVLDALGEIAGGIGWEADGDG